MKDSTFHRTIIIFMCTSMTCLLKDQHEQWKRNSETSSRRYLFLSILIISRNFYVIHVCDLTFPSLSVKVFRCQLPRFNSFYPSEPPKADGSDQPLTSGGEFHIWFSSYMGFNRKFD